MSAGETRSVEENLAWEAQYGSRAAITAILAGLATIAGTILGGVALRNRPSVTIPHGLRDALDPGSQHGLLEKTVRFVHDHITTLTIGQAMTALSAPLTALALVYLFRAVRARRPEFGQGALIAIAIGGVASFVGILVGQIAVDAAVSNFLHAGHAHGTKAAHDALQPSLALTSGLIAFVGHVALGLGIVLIALNAMRVGLLTRFMGVLGIMAGVFLAFPFFSIPIVQAFWLVGIGMLFLGRFPNGAPPAWETGRAEPWPSRQEMLEAQQRAKEGRGGSAPAPPRETGRTPKDLPPPAPVEPGAEKPTHSRSKKKKRRR
jgi:hypothetical protein